MNHTPPPPPVSDPPVYDDPRHGGTEADIRRRVYPEPLVLIPGLLTTGLTLLAAGPKIGKSVLSQQIEHYLAAGVPFKGWPPPQHRHRVMVWDLEGNAEATQDTSFRLAPDAADEAFGLIEYSYQADLPMAGGMPALLAKLAAELTEARAAGVPYTYVRIDTMRLFTGSRPGAQNAYDFDAQANAVLNQLGLEHQCAVVLLHHLSKGSEESGDWLERLNGSMGVSGSASSIWLLERARGASTGVWRTTSRRLPEAEHALEYIGGRWSFAENLTVDQAQHTGVPRRIVDYLTAHPTARWAQLRELGPPATVRKALTRLGHSRTVEQVEGVWSLVRQPDNPAAQPEPVRPAPDTGWPIGTLGDEIRRAALREQMHAPMHEQPHIPVPEPRTAPDDSGQDRTETERNETERNETEQDRSALSRLKDAIGTVTERPCRPIPLIRKEDRDAGPWPIACQTSENRHNWRAPGIEQMSRDRRVVVLDRRASYPSALSSVAVAPNMLLHRPGPDTSPDPGKAGLHLVKVPRWHADKIGHVLGSAAEGAETLWITTPSLHALLKVHRSVEIVDQWVGRRISSLFEGYYQWCKTERARLMAARPSEDDTDAYASWEAKHAEWEAEYGAHKKGSSQAIRMIYPKNRESGLWRPDWHAAILSEANVRHWMKAYTSGAECLAMRNTDEVMFALPVGAGGDWVPDGYRVGVGFGCVSVVFRGTLGQWWDKLAEESAARHRRRRGDR